MKTEDYPTAGTKSEVCLRFVGANGKTEWLLCAGHEQADIQADLSSGSTVRTMVKLPDLGEVTTCCGVLRGPSADQWHPDSVEVKDADKSYQWRLSGPLVPDQPVAWHSPSVHINSIPVPLGALSPDAIAEAEQLMAKFKSEWEVGSPDSATARQAVAEVVARLFASGGSSKRSWVAPELPEQKKSGLFATITRLLQR